MSRAAEGIWFLMTTELPRTLNDNTKPQRNRCHSFLLWIRVTMIISAIITAVKKDRGATFHLEKVSFYFICWVELWSETHWGLWRLNLCYCRLLFVCFLSWVEVIFANKEDIFHRMFIFTAIIPHFNISLASTKWESASIEGVCALFSSGLNSTLARESCSFCYPPVPRVAPSALRMFVK